MSTTASGELAPWSTGLHSKSACQAKGSVPSAPTPNICGERGAGLPALSDPGTSFFTEYWRAVDLPLDLYSTHHILNNLNNIEIARYGAYHYQGGQ